MLKLNNILLARDFSSASNHALRHAVDLARRTGAALHLLYAQVLHEDPFGPSAPDRSGSPEDRIRHRLRRDVDDTSLAKKYPELTLHERVERDIAAAPAILDYAAGRDVDLIVMGTHGRRGVRRFFLGSVAEEVVRRADQPVLTVHQGKEDVRAVTPPPPVERILVPVDFSYHAREALLHACAVAELYEAELDLLHVIEENLHPAFYVGGVQSIYDVEPDIEDKVRERLHAFYAEADAPSKPEMTVYATPGRAAREIPRFAAEHDADLIVMSTHGLTGFEHFMMGSVAEKVVRHADVPVFTVKAFGRSLIESHAVEPRKATV